MEKRGWKQWSSEKKEREKEIQKGKEAGWPLQYSSSSPPPLLLSSPALPCPGSSGDPHVCTSFIPPLPLSACARLRARAKERVC